MRSEAIGVAFDAQRVKLAGKSWATVTMIVTVGSSRNSRQIRCRAPAGHDDRRSWSSRSARLGPEMQRI